jgi:ribonuclease P protein component
MIERLKKRRDFLAAAKGRKAARRAFVLETRERADGGPPRFGFTVSKRTAKKAVERNRIRRRLKEAVRLSAPGRARPGHDYVLVGRPAALRESFAAIAADLAGALPDSADRARRPRRSGVPGTTE